MKSTPLIIQKKIRTTIGIHVIMEVIFVIYFNLIGQRNSYSNNLCLLNQNYNLSPSDNDDHF